jgi:hypothetical protein
MTSSSSSSSLRVLVLPLPAFILCTFIIANQDAHALSIRHNAHVSAHHHHGKHTGTGTGTGTGTSTSTSTSLQASWINNFGTSALNNVQNLADSVTRANDYYYEQPTQPTQLQPTPPTQQQPSQSDKTSPSIPKTLRNTGNTGNLYSTTTQNSATFDADASNNSNNSNNSYIKTNTKSQNKKVVLSALESLERDMQLLDNITAEKTQLSQLEITLLSLSVAAAGSGPLFFGVVEGYKVAEVLAPACAARKYG